MNLVVVSGLRRKKMATAKIVTVFTERHLFPGPQNERLEPATSLQC